MDPAISYEEFVTNWKTLICPKTSQEVGGVGKSLMLYLLSVWPEEYTRLSSVHYYDRTDIDCYYKDELVDNTLEHLQSVWPQNIIAQHNT